MNGVRADFQNGSDKAPRAGWGRPHSIIVLIKTRRLLFSDTEESVTHRRRGRECRA